MPTLQVGRTEIAYELRRSMGAAERRITVTPDHVEVLALADDDDAAICAFLDRKRQWLFNAVREVEKVNAGRHAVPRFMTGSKIPYRGRKMPLTVRRTDRPHADVSYHNGFIVDLPEWAGSDTDHLVSSELKLWLKRRVRRDVEAIVARYRDQHSLNPASVRCANLNDGWGSCAEGGHVLINWHLIFAPARVLEYVVAHELAHLRHRSHGPAFWAYLGAIYPRFDKPKAWLARNEVSLSSAFFARASQGVDSASAPLAARPTRCVRSSPKVDTVNYARFRTTSKR